MSDSDTIKNINDYSNIEARYYQIDIDDAISLRPIDLFNDIDNNNVRLLSRADLILIYVLYENGLNEFLIDYKNYAKTMRTERGYKVINKPHYYLKNLIG